MDGNMGTSYGYNMLYHSYFWNCVYVINDKPRWKRLVLRIFHFSLLRFLKKLKLLGVCKH